jgi:hypothetical protein
MCHERYLRLRREADESREVWQDFERTQPVGDAPTPQAAAEPETAEERDAIAVSER